jgi:copper(I)-binding protein
MPVRTQDRIMFRKLLTTTLVVMLLGLCSGAIAGGITHGDLMIQHPTIRATAPGAKVGAGYLTITNNGQTADRLIGGTAAFAGKTEIHEMKIDNEVMKMRRLENGVEVGPGETVHLAPGGEHIMFMMLKEPLTVGERRSTSLNFESAGKIDIMFDVKSIGDTMKMKRNK